MISSFAHAELKPENTLLVSACDSRIEPFQLCIAEGPASKVVYLVISKNVTKRIKIGNKFVKTEVYSSTYIPVENKYVPQPNEPIGVGHVDFVGYGVDTSDPNYAIEKAYQFKGTRVLNPTASLQYEGTLSINGSAIRTKFRLERVAHTE